MTKTLILGVALSCLALTAGCSSGAKTSPGNSSSAAGPVSTTPAATAPGAAASSSGAASGTVLKGSVGSASDPDAFVIGLTDATGAKVTGVPAGHYTIEVHDPSKMHDFHLQGDGVNQTTTVPEVKDTTFTVDLKAGQYTYRCDPHSRMVGTITVT